MSNASGIPNGVMSSYRRDPVLTAQEVSALDATKLWGREPLESKPGTTWDYSLTNWVIVRAVIESATGQSFETVFHDEVVAALGLNATGIPGPSFPEADDDAQNYSSVQPATSKPNRVPTYAAAAGTIYSSAANLRKILDEVFNDHYLDRESRRQLTSINVETQGYALGGRVVDLADTPYKLLWESGETSNYRSLVAYEPMSGACVIFLDNSGISTDALADAARITMRQLLLR